ncbi:MAG: GGDEF domain-containing protein [Psychrobium sp.]
MKFSENSNQAANYLRQAVPKMVEHDIVPNPLNYTLWYSYFSKAYPTLNTALESTVARYGTCPADVSESLFLEHIIKSDDQIHQNNEIQQSLVHLVSDLSCNIEKTVRETSVYSGALKENIMDLGTAGLSEDLTEKLNQLSSNASGLCSANDAFQTQLEQAQSEIETLKQELEKTQSQASTDALTGLGNRRVFERIFAQYANSEETRMSVVMIDIDRFKVFNDTHGHLMGDQILQFVGKLLKQECPEPITPVRFGGEEFALLCPEVEIDNVQAIAETIRTKLSKVAFSNKRTGERIEPVTASFGIATKRSNELLENLVERADSALYAAKNNGRNQVQLAS